MKKILMICQILILSFLQLKAQVQTKNITEHSDNSNYNNPIPNTTSGNNQHVISGKSYALIIGISNYKDASIDRLNYCRDDAINFFQFLTSKYCDAGIDEKNVVRLFDDEATKDGIIKALTDMGNSAEANSNLYFYYSGHGTANYILPSDMNIKDATTMIGYDYLIDKINSSGKFKNKIIVLDACYSGSVMSFLERDASPQDLFQKQNKMWEERKNSSGGYVIFASSPKDKTSLEQKFGGLFTRTLIDGLKCFDEDHCADQNNDGIITAVELYNYLSGKLATTVTPVYKGNDGYPMSVLYVAPAIASTTAPQISTVNNKAKSVQIPVQNNNTNSTIQANNATVSNNPSVANNPQSTTANAKYDGNNGTDATQDGYGTYVYPTGDKYEGNWKDYRKNGHGVFTWVNGNKYDGNWENDQITGQGTFTWSNGNSFTGDWKNNKIEGKGIYTWRNGNKYQGDWKNGKKVGQGLFTWSNGNTYDGGWENDKKNGYGVYSSKSGYDVVNCPRCAVYKGSWKNNLKSGKGDCYGLDGAIVYSGDFVNDMPVGNYPY
jgi:hypothetical protein